VSKFVKEKSDEEILEYYFFMKDIPGLEKSEEQAVKNGLTYEKFLKIIHLLKK